MVGKVIRGLATKNNLSIPDIAAAANLNKTTLYNYLNGNTPITLDAIEKISKVLNVSLGDIFREYEKGTHDDIELNKVDETTKNILENHFKESSELKLSSLELELILEKDKLLRELLDAKNELVKYQGKVVEMQDQLLKMPKKLVNKP